MGYKYRIGIDLMGGDTLLTPKNGRLVEEEAFSRANEGVLRFLNKFDDTQIVGFAAPKAAQSDRTIERYPNSYSIMLCKDYLDMSGNIVSPSGNIEKVESLKDLLRKGKNTTIMQGMKSLEEGTIDAFFSAGESGTIGLLSNMFRNKSVSKLSAIAQTPSNSLNRYFFLADAGVSVDCSPSDLLTYAVLGSAYIKSVTDIQVPKVGILSIGTEAKKGNRFVKEALPYFERFEGIDKVFSKGLENWQAEPENCVKNEIDLIVGDAFSVNIFLKALKAGGGIPKNRTIQLYDESPIYTKSLGYIAKIFGGSILRKLKASVDPGMYAGAPILGIDEKIILITHGSSSALAYQKTLEKSRMLLEKKFAETIKGYYEILPQARSK